MLPTRLLTVAERELRAAARRRSTYFVRWLTAVSAFVIFLWLFWAFDGFTNPGAAPEVFQVFSVFVFLYCLVVGIGQTADCLCSEKREGTLGLLYLTNLNSAEIVIGKLCSSAIAAAYGLIAIFPILALPLLLGGITYQHFWLTVLAMLNAILFALAVGMRASAACQRQFTAVATAVGLTFIMGGGFLLAAALLKEAYGASGMVKLVAILSPVYPLMAADATPTLGGNYYWVSLAANVAFSLGLLCFTGMQLSRTWQDKATSVRSVRFSFWRRGLKPAGHGDVAFRRRLLDVNPFFWLAGRKRISSPVFMLLVLLLVLLTVFATGPYFGRKVFSGSSSTLEGGVFAWMWTGLALYGLALYYAAMVASQRLAEDKQTGALEMVLCTPTDEKSIARGLWLAYGRRMFFPVLACVGVHCLFIWLCLNMFVLAGWSEMTRRMTTTELFWALVWDQPIRGVTVHWSYVFLFHCLVLIQVLFFAAVLTLGGLGRWLGLRMKRPGFAPFVSLALVFIPPIIAFSFVCYFADKFDWDQLPERRFLPLMMWVAFGMGAGHCALLSWWSTRKFQREFRTTVTSRFQPAARWRWWRPTWRGLRRFIGRTAGVALTLALLVWAYLGYQNWRSSRGWRIFQAELAQQGASLDLEPLLPPLVAEEQNFARHPAFLSLQFVRSPGRSGGLNMSSPGFLDQAYNRYSSGQKLTMEWTGRESASLAKYAELLSGQPLASSLTNQTAAAGEVLRLLEPLADQLATLATAAQRPYLQFATHRDALAVIRIPTAEAMKLEQLHFVFMARAEARLTLGYPGAAEDLQTSLRLAQLAEQLPDVKSSLRVQVMLLRSFQPYWEGLGRHAWSEVELAAMQRQLEQFDLLGNHTNAVRRIARAHIAVWRDIAENPTRPKQMPSANGGYMFVDSWRWQPRAWWWDKCIQLYHAAEASMQRVDAVNQRVRLDYDWEALNGLNLSEEAEQVMENYYWGQGNPTVLAYAQAALSQAILAGALERYRLANGQYPETLGQLVPGYLDQIPKDIMRGREMIYEHAAAAPIVLRSVGPNEQDDHGKSSSDDWWWTYPTNLFQLPPAELPSARP